MLETCTHDIAQLPLVPGDLVSPGNDIEPEEHGQGFRVHFVGLHLSVGDRLQVLGVGKRAAKYARMLAGTFGSRS